MNHSEEEYFPFHRSQVKVLQVVPGSHGYISPTVTEISDSNL